MAEITLEDFEIRIFGEKKIRCSICGKDAAQYGSYRKGGNFPKIICPKCAFELQEIGSPDKDLFCDWCGRKIEGHGWIKSNLHGLTVCGVCMKKGWVTT